MTNFTYERAGDAPGAQRSVLAVPGSRYIAGGTTLLDLMKLGVEAPSHLVDITHLPLASVRVGSDSLIIGALARMADVAEHEEVVRAFPCVAQSLLLAASAQLRNMATTGGNLLQRTRCPYFRDTTFACNKRLPGSGCSALRGDHRNHAVLGTSAHCIATHASDLAVALTALEAQVELLGESASRMVAVEGLFREPGEHPEIENVLIPGELIISIHVPRSEAARRSVYLKVRDRESYEFALASAAVALETESGIVRDVRIALGGVATRPWRARAAEEYLKGRMLDGNSASEAGRIAMQGASPLRQNAFKVLLAQQTVAEALVQANALEVQA